MIYLDPHVTQATQDVGQKESPEELAADSTYHTDKPYRIHMKDISSSLALVSDLFRSSCDAGCWTKGKS